MVYSGDMYYAWAADREIRLAAHNGGLITALLAYLLDTGRVHAAVVMREGCDVFEAVPTVVTDARSLVGTSGTFIAGGELLAPLVFEYVSSSPGSRVAVVCKGCDAKALFEMAKRSRVILENLVLIGVSCSGTFSPTALERFVNQHFSVLSEDIIWVGTHKEHLVVKSLKDGAEVQHSISLEEAADLGLHKHEWCMRCNAYIPRQCDIVCGSIGVVGKLEGFVTFVEICTKKGADILTHADADRAIWLITPEHEGISKREALSRSVLKAAVKKRDEQFERLGSESQRLKVIMHETGHCVRCEQCIDACPLCTCHECSTKKSWLVEPNAVPPPFMFHLLRFSHVADSCVNCGQCELRCPMHIPNSLFMHAAQLELEQMFGYKPGNPASRPHLAKLHERDSLEYHVVGKKKGENLGVEHR